MIRRLWMICYDIADDDRRVAAARRLLAEGERVQDSVYECFLNGDQLERLLLDLAARIDPREDRVAAYPLCSWCRQRVRWQGLGRKPDDPAYWQV